MTLSLMQFRKYKFSMKQDLPETTSTTAPGSFLEA